MRFANPETGVYVSKDGQRLFILSEKDGPYPLADGFGEFSLYTYEDEESVYPKTVIKHPFSAVRIGSL